MGLLQELWGSYGLLHYRRRCRTLCNKSSHAARLATPLWLIKAQRSEGGHRQFDDEKVQRIEEIKHWIESGVPVGKVKALREGENVNVRNG